MNFRANIKNLKLYFRFACRRFGLRGYQLHQIYLPDQDLLYIPIPKNASSSTKHALYEVEYGKRFDYGLKKNDGFEDIHDYYKKRADAFTSVNKLRNMDSLTRFAIVRDPVERLVSCYRNRVVDLGDLRPTEAALKRVGLPLEPDLNTFVLNLRQYRNINKVIEHHSRPQSRFLGGTLKYLDRIVPMEQIAELEEMLQRYKPGLNMLEKKSGGTEVDTSDLSRKALNSAIRFYRKDYRLLRDFYTPDKTREKLTI